MIFGKKIIGHKICLFSAKLSPEESLFLRRLQRNAIVNVHKLYRIVPLIHVRFKKKTRIFSIDYRKKLLKYEVS